MKFKVLSVAIAMGTVAGWASAKIAAPVLTPEAKVKAAEATAKTAWSNKVADFQLCKSQDRVAAHYLVSVKNKPAAASAAAPAAPSATPACGDPGAFAFTPETEKTPPPLEAAGAHSPPKTASTPPNTTAPAAQIAPTVKK